MLNLSRIFFILLLSTFLCSACASKAPEFDIRGEWTYTMTATDGNTYDNGIITFSGDPSQGTYRQVNIYQVEYEGDFTAKGSDLVLTGDETWAGTIVDANNLSGTWSHADGASGTFTAVRN
jgi:hypothetical protein